MGAYFVPEILGIVFACLGKKQGKMRGQAIASLVCNILSLVIFTGMVIAVIISPSESDADSRNYTSGDTETLVVDEDFSEVVESEAKDSEKEDIGTSDDQYRDGREIIFEVIMPTVSQIFFEHDTVTITGIYSHWNSQFGYGEILIDGITMEYYEK